MELIIGISGYFLGCLAAWGIGRCCHCTGFAIVAAIVVGPIGLLYFAPKFVASYRHHPNVDAITMLNLLLGWTVIGWVVALVWAMMVQQSTLSLTHQP